MKESRSPDGDDRRAAVALAFVRGVGCATYRERVGQYGAAAIAFLESVQGPDASDALQRADSTLAAVERSGATLLLLGEPGYPAALLDLPDPPPLLFALGSLSALNVPAAGIVGTRHASASGERMARRLAAAVVRAGGCVVSGLARGIDTAAHRGAVDASGVTVAVLGGGVDVAFLATHRTLYHTIRDTGLVLSEAIPGTPPWPAAFPRRNRIIAALSRAVAVVEAGDRSGALITANHAMELGRALGAVPGSIDAPQSVGTNRLLAMGAAVITSPDDLLALATLPATSRPAGAVAGSEATTFATGTMLASGSEEQAVLHALREGASDHLELARATRLSPRELSAALASLEIAGVLWTDHSGLIRLAHDPAQ